jgi:hypothetical protein
MPNATKILSEKRILPGAYIMDITVWGVRTPVLPCTHPFKYRLFFGQPGARMVADDNEKGKGDHKHIRDVEYPYTFVSLRQLMIDFVRDVETFNGVEIKL